MNVNFEMSRYCSVTGCFSNNASRNISIHRYEIQACHYLTLFVLALSVLVLLNRNLWQCSGGEGGGGIVAQLFITLKRRLKIFQGFQEVRGPIRLISSFLGSS